MRYRRLMGNQMGMIRLEILRLEGRDINWNISKKLSRVKIG